MSAVNISFSVYEHLEIVGAFSFDKQNLLISVSFCFFSHCTRSQKQGGAIFCNSADGNASIRMSCFEYCFTNSFNIVDFGQTAYLDCSRVDFVDNCYSFCSPDFDQVRHAGVFIQNADARVERINASNGKCRTSAGALLMHPGKLTFSDCTMVDMISSDSYDTICLMHSKEDSKIQRIQYIRCSNPSNGSTNLDTSFRLTISDCIIANCTNFPDSRYDPGSNIKKSTEAIETFPIYKERCIGRAAPKNCRTDMKKVKMLMSLLFVSILT